MKVALVGRAFEKKYIPEVTLAINELRSHGVEITFQESLYNFLIKNSIISGENEGVFSELESDVDFIITIGGDGTILEAITLIKDKNIPLLGINAGRLGFVSTTPIEDSLLAIKALINGNYTLDSRMLVKFESDHDIFGETNFGLNEFAIQKRDTSSMIIIHTYIDDQFLNSYWADGLIISTPTGSTGYSLSCGGPLMMPQNRNFIVAPVNPHNLNVRPLIVTNDAKITLKVEGRGSKILVSLDSRSVSVPMNTEITISKTDFNVQLIQLNDYSYFNTLRSKLNWGQDYRN